MRILGITDMEAMRQCADIWCNYYLAAVRSLKLTSDSQERNMILDLIESYENIRDDVFGDLH